MTRPKRGRYIVTCVPSFLTPAHCSRSLRHAMPDTPPIDVRPEHWCIVRSILRRHIPDREVWAFGSRARGSAKIYSDLDLAVIGKMPLPLRISAALAEDFS